MLNIYFQYLFFSVVADVWDRQSMLNLVDLAGSESISHLSSQMRQSECRHINKSLLGLARVILKLAQQSEHGISFVWRVHVETESEILFIRGCTCALPAYFIDT